MSEKQDLGTVDLTVRTLNVLQNVNAPNISRIETKTIQNTADAVIIRAEVQAEIAVVTGLANVAQATATAAKFRVITALTDAAQYLNEIVWYQSQLYRCTTLSPVAWTLESAIQPSSTGLVAAWPGEEVPEYPDAASPTYLQKDWLTVDGWATEGVDTVVSVASGELVLTKGATPTTFVRAKLALAVSSKTVRVKWRSAQADLTTMEVGTTGAGTHVTKSIAGQTSGIVDIPTGASFTDFEIMFNSTGNNTTPVYIKFIYVGDGSYVTVDPDGSGNKQHGTMYGITPVAGERGKMRLLDGVNDYEIKTLDTPTKILTISCRAKVIENGAAKTLFSTYKYNSGSSGSGFYVSPQSATLVRFSAGRTGTSEQNAYITYTWDTTAEHEYSAVFHEATRTFEFLVDGISVGSTSAFDATINLTASYIILGRPAGDSSGYNLNVHIGKAYWWNRELSAQELRGLALGLRPSLPYSLVDWRTDPANPANVVATTAPKYLGKYLDAAPTAHAIGDTYCRYSATSGATNRGVFAWSGTAWVRTEVQSAIMAAGSDIGFIIAYKNTASPPVAIYGTAADYTADATIQADYAFFQAAFIGYLEAYEISVRNRLKTKDGYAYVDAEADTDDDVKGIVASSVPIENTPANGTYLSMTNLYNFLGSRLPGLIWKSVASSVWANLAAIVYTLTTFIIKNVTRGVSLAVGDLNGHVTITKSATATDSGTDSVINVDRINAIHKGRQKAAGYLQGTYTMDELYHALIGQTDGSTIYNLVCLHGVISSDTYRWIVAGMYKYSATEVRVIASRADSGALLEISCADGGTGSTDVTLSW
jgi:hypothetical protein